MWGYFIVMIIAAIVSYALAPKPPSPKPPGLEDLDVPTAEEARPIPVVFGTYKITGPNVVWYGDLSAIKIRKKSGK